MTPEGVGVALTLISCLAPPEQLPQAVSSLQANIEVGEARMRCSHRSGVIPFFHVNVLLYGDSSSTASGPPSPAGEGIGLQSFGIVVFRIATPERCNPTLFCYHAEILPSLSLGTFSTASS